MPSVSCIIYGTWPFLRDPVTRKSDAYTVLINDAIMYR